MMRGIIVLLLLVLAVAVFVTPVAAASVEDLSKELMCQCGCTMIVYNCDCSTADQMRQVIRTKLDEGKTPPEIISYFKDQYGEVVLTAPTKEGFNLTAWIFPFVAILVGAVVIFIVLKRWFVNEAEPELAVGSLEAAGDLGAYEERLQRELQQYQGS